MYLLPPPPSHPLRPTSLKMFVNLPHCPGFDEVSDMRPVMDIDLSNPPKGVIRTVDGQREVEEWGLKVQKMASVHSITLVLVSLSVDHSLQSPPSHATMSLWCDLTPALEYLNAVDRAHQISPNR